MTPGSTKIVVYAALAGNSMIAITKFAAAAYTGSSAMLSEAIHSVVDTGNQGLILYGMKRAERPPDSEHPFGYGMELYFWTFVVAILIFAVGSGVSIYGGIAKVIEPHLITNPLVNYIVLGIAMVFEAGAWWVAFKTFRKTQGKLGFFAAVRRSKDPAVFTVLFEDTAAMFGLMVAFFGIWAAQHLGIPELDGVASIVIGLILAGVAMLLASESKGLLIGEGAAPEVVSAIREMADTTDGVIAVNELRTMHLGPEEVLLNLSIDFDDALDSVEVEAAISDLEQRIKQEHPSMTRVFIEAQSRLGHAADQRATEGGGGDGA